MDELSQQWMAYIDAEVRAACGKRGLGVQVRRKWSVRAKPVSRSPVEDYEWKLVVGTRSNLPEKDPRKFDEGRYYVLWLDRAGGKFIFQHDSCFGDEGSEMPFATFTAIRLLAFNNTDYLRVRRETSDAGQAHVLRHRRRPSGFAMPSSVSQSAFSRTGSPSLRRGCLTCA